MKVLAVIPARSGSKSIPNKNIVNLNGKPLIAYTIEEALKVPSLDRVIVSTDSSIIKDIAIQHGAEVPYIRPQELAADETPTKEVILNLLESLATESYLPDYVMILQPTSPLRKSDHIAKAIEKLRGSAADSLVSVVKVPHNMNPESVMVLNSLGLLENYQAGEKKFRRQEKNVLWARNGAAIYLAKSDVFKDLSHMGCWGSRVVPFEMDRISSLDIDEPEDLDFVRKFL